MSVEEALPLLQRGHVRLDDGLSADELSGVETRFGFAFAPEHAALLGRCLPTGERWPDWRRGSEDSLRAWLDSPVAGVLFDVAENSFWPASWGPRPQDSIEALDIAKGELLQWPQMVPLYSHRFMAAGRRGRRVFSIHQSDVIYYGNDLSDYLRRELFGHCEPPLGSEPDPIWPWSALADGAADADL